VAAKRNFEIYFVRFSVAFSKKFLNMKKIWSVEISCFWERCKGRNRNSTENL